MGLGRLGKRFDTAVLQGLAGRPAQSLFELMRTDLAGDNIGEILQRRVYVVGVFVLAVGPQQLRERGPMRHRQGHHTRVMSLILHRTLPLSTGTTAAAHGASRSALNARRRDDLLAPTGHGTESSSH